MQDEDIIILDSNSPTPQPEIIEIDEGGDECRNVPKLEVPINNVSSSPHAFSPDLKPSCCLSNDSHQQMKNETNETEKLERDRILKQWLLQNYIRTDNEADTVKVGLVFSKAVEYYLSVCKGQISQEEVTSQVHSTFGRLPIIERLASNQMIVQFFGCLGERSNNVTVDHHEMSAPKMRIKPFDGDIAKQWLFDHYERTENPKSLVASRSILNKLSKYLNSLGEFPVTRQKLGFLLRSVFGSDLMSKQMYVQDRVHGFYPNLKEKGDHGDAKNDQKIESELFAPTPKFEHGEMALEWLRNNYEPGGNRDVTSSTNLRNDLLAYLRLNGVEPLPTNQRIGNLVLQQFGRLPYVRIGPQLKPHYAYLKRKGVSEVLPDSKIKRTEKDEIAIEWLLKNYKKTGNPSDKVNSKVLRCKLSSYLNSRGQDSVSAFTYGTLMRAAFGQLNYVCMKCGPDTVGFYDQIKAITGSDQSDVFRDMRNEQRLDSERIAVDWLNGFYEKSERADHSIRRKVIYDKTNAYLQSIGKEPLSARRISFLIGRIFGDLPLLRTTTDSYHFSNLKEKSTVAATPVSGERTDAKFEKQQVQTNFQENQSGEEKMVFDKKPTMDAGQAGEGIERNQVRKTNVKIEQTQRSEETTKGLDVENSEINAKELDDPCEIVVRWLESNYKRTKCASDLVNCNEVINKLQAHFHELGRKPLPISLIDNSILWVFEKLPLTARPRARGAPDTFYYRYLKERTASDSEGEQIPK